MLNSPNIGTSHLRDKIEECCCEIAIEVVLGKRSGNTGDIVFCFAHRLSICQRERKLAKREERLALLIQQSRAPAFAASQKEIPHIDVFAVVCRTRPRL